MTTVSDRLVTLSPLRLLVHSALLGMTVGFLSSCATPVEQTQIYVDGFQDVKAATELILDDAVALRGQVPGPQPDPARSATLAWPPTNFAPQGSGKTERENQFQASITAARDSLTALDNYNQILLARARGENLSGTDTLVGTFVRFATSGITRAIPGAGTIVGPVFEILQSARTRAEFSRALRLASEPTALISPDGTPCRVDSLDCTAAVPILCTESAVTRAEPVAYCVAVVPKLLMTWADLAPIVDKLHETATEAKLNRLRDQNQDVWVPAFAVLRKARPPSAVAARESWNRLMASYHMFIRLTGCHERGAAGKDGCPENIRQELASIGKGTGTFPAGEGAAYAAAMDALSTAATVEVQDFYRYRIGLRDYQTLVAKTEAQFARIRTELDKPIDPTALATGVRSVLPPADNLGRGARMVLDTLLPVSPSRGS